MSLCVHRLGEGLTEFATLLVSLMEASMASKEISVDATDAFMGSNRNCRRIHRHLHGTLWKSRKVYRKPCKHLRESHNIDVSMTSTESFTTSESFYRTNFHKFSWKLASKVKLPLSFQVSARLVRLPRNLNFYHFPAQLRCVGTSLRVTLLHEIHGHWN